MRTTVRRSRHCTLTGVALAVLTLPSCGTLGDDPDTITYWLWDANQQPAYQQCADDFEQLHPDLTVRIEQRFWDDYWNNLALGFVADSAPDVFTNHLSKYGEFVSRDLMLPLDDHVARDDVPLDIYEKGLADLWLGPDGHRYGLPKDWDTVALFYNKDMLAEAGISEEEMQNLSWNPEDGGTYEDVIARLTVDVNGVRGDEPGFDKDRIKTYGLWLDGIGVGDSHGQIQWSMYAASNGWRATDDNPWGTRFNYDDPQFQEAFAWWKSLADKGYMPDLAEQEGALSGDQFAAGKTAMATHGSWMISTFFGFQGMDVGLAPTPVGPTGQRASMFNGLADSVYAGTDNPEAAWEWVRYLASPACQRVVGEHHAVFPATTEAWEIAKQRFAEGGVDVSAFTRHVEDGTTVLFPITEHAADVAAILTPAMEAVLSGKAPVESMSRANERINQLFE